VRKLSTKNLQGEEQRDEHFMRLALRLAKKGKGWVSPNPMVGAVLVRGERVIGQGYHRVFGGPHAEVEALRSASGSLQDSELFVNLEPCCHYGKTPPCTKAILEAGIGRVVIGTLDPNPLVRGKGAQELREAGVSVKVGVLEEECRDLNRVFFHFMESGRPWVTLKWAQSLDGYIAPKSGRSRWISSEQSRKLAHSLRAEHDAVLVGAGTVRNDDPRLTVRHVKGRDPVRIVLTQSLQVPVEARVMDPSRGRVLIFYPEPGDEERVSALEMAGAQLRSCKRDPRGGVDLDSLLGDLASMGISSVLVEGGARVLTSFLKARQFQRVVCFVAPILLGEGKRAVDDLGVEEVSQALRFSSARPRRVGTDLLWELEGPES